MSSNTIEHPHENSKRHWILLFCVLLHAAIIYALFHASHSIRVESNLRQLIVKFLPLSQPEKDDKILIPTPAALPKQITKKTISGEVVEPTPSTTNQEITESRPQVIDPFAIKTAPNPVPTNAEKFSRNIGAVLREMEKEHPIRKQLYANKTLTPMEKFAKQVLESAPAREVTMTEEIRADGARMTRVKTPRGEFCVLAPAPGRPQDLIIAEKRIFQVCPIEF